MNKPISDSKSFVTASPVRLSSSPARTTGHGLMRRRPGLLETPWLPGRMCRRLRGQWAGSVTTFYVASQGDCLGGGCAIGWIAEPSGQIPAL